MLAWIIRFNVSAERGEPCTRKEQEDGLRLASMADISLSQTQNKKQLKGQLKQDKEASQKLKKQLKQNQTSRLTAGPYKSNNKKKLPIKQRDKAQSKEA